MSPEVFNRGMLIVGEACVELELIGWEGVLE